MSKAAGAYGGSSFHHIALECPANGLPTSAPPVSIAIPSCLATLTHSPSFPHATLNASTGNDAHTHACCGRTQLSEGHTHGPARSH